MKQHILALSGISGSGKTTYARELVREAQGYIRVNRDELRQMLFGYTEFDSHEHYTNPGIREREELVSIVQDEMIGEIIKFGKSVLVDNTNLKQKYLKELNKFGVPVVNKIIEVPLETAVLRDANRTRSVGREVIERQYADLRKMKNKISCQCCGTEQHVGLAKDGRVIGDTFLCLSCSTRPEYKGLTIWSVLDNQNSNNENIK